MPPSDFFTRLEQTFAQLGVFVPTLLGSLVILFAGYLLAKLVEKGTNRLLRRLRFNDMLERGGVMEAVERSGAFAMVLECMPADLAAKVTAMVSIPTIGIGAGPGCDGQVLVFHDLLGLYPDFRPKFAKRYADLGDQVRKAIETYSKEVREGTFPGAEHSFR